MKIRLVLHTANKRAVGDFDVVNLAALKPLSDLCRPVVASFVTVALAIALCIADVQPVQSHAFPDVFSPRPNDILETAPSELRLRFTESVVATSSHVVLRAQTGKIIYEGIIPPVDPENLELAILIPALRKGVYLVDWQVLSSIDGHTTRGSFSFNLGVRVLGPDVELSEQVTPLSFVARGLILAGIVLVLGLFAFRLLVWSPLVRGIEPEAEVTRLDQSQAWVGLRLAWIGLSLFVVGSLLTLMEQSSPYGVFQGDDLQTWLDTRLGFRWMLRLCLVVSVILLLTTLRSALRDGVHGLRGWEWWAGLAGGGGLAWSHALMSHSAAVLQSPARAIAIELSHTLAAGVWIGGLLFLLLCLWQGRRLSSRARTGVALQLALNFSTLAALAVGVILLSGGYLAWLHVGGWATLIETAYGWVLLGKVSLALPALGLAAMNLLVMKPRLQAAYENPSAATSLQAMRRFRRLVGGEAALTCLILLAAGTLASMPRGQDVLAERDASGRAVMTAVAKDLTVALTLNPAVVGQNTFDVSLTDADGNPVTNVRAVSLRYTLQSTSSGRQVSSGTATSNAVSQDDGHYTLEGSYISVTGTWAVEVAIRRPDTFDTFATYRLEVDANGRIRPIEDRGQWVDTWAQRLTWLNGAVLGSGLMLFATAWGSLATRAAKHRWQTAAFLLMTVVVFGFGAQQLVMFLRADFTPTKFRPNPHLANADSIVIGKRLYQTHCVACHGLAGQGRGHLAWKLPKPPTAFIVSLTATHSDGDLFHWIQHGVQGTAMPAFAGYLSPDEAWHVVNYVRRLRGDR